MRLICRLGSPVKVRKIDGGSQAREISPFRPTLGRSLLFEFEESCAQGGRKALFVGSA
jgi:hypothetical protein